MRLPTIKKKGEFEFKNNYKIKFNFCIYLNFFRGFAGDS